MYIDKKRPRRNNLCHIRINKKKRTTSCEKRRPNSSETPGSLYVVYYVQVFSVNRSFRFLLRTLSFFPVDRDSKPDPGSKYLEENKSYRTQRVFTCND